MQFLYILLAIILYFCIISFVLIQPLGAIIRLIYTKRRDSKYAIGLKRYLGILIIFYSYCLIITSYEIKINQFVAIINIASMFVILFAYWFHILTWHFKHKRIKEFDRIQKAKNNPSLLLEVPCQERLELNNTQISMVDLSNWNSDLRVAQ